MTIFSRIKDINIKQFIDSIRIRKLLMLFPFVFMLHELEEWNILPWHRQFQSNIPADVTSLDLRTIFLFLIFLFFVYTYISLIPKNKKVNSCLLLPVITLISYNGVVHLYWSFYFGTYAPGVIFGFFIGVPFAFLIIYKILKEKLVPKWYASIFILLGIFLFIQAVMLGDQIEDGLVKAMLFSKKLAAWLWFR
ncbi:MAG: HXXEE domain-containing protein [Spirochaetes bacterium]|nr:HXXEE domain-containing protein [Spirochaetota bacterium]